MESNHGVQPGDMKKHVKYATKYHKVGTKKKK